MDRILERHDDVGTLGVYLYEKESTLYIDKKCTKEATVEDAHFAFLRRGVVVGEDGSMSEITSFSENETAAESISYGSSASSGSGVDNILVYVSSGAGGIMSNMAYADEKFTTVLKTSELINAFNKGCVVVGPYGNSYYRPVSLVVDTYNNVAYLTATGKKAYDNSGVIELKDEEISIQSVADAE